MSIPSLLSPGLLLEIFLSHITPILIAAGIGFIFARIVNPDVKSLARLAFYVFSPCLVFTGLATSTLDGGEFWRLAGFAISTVAVSGSLAWAIGKSLKMGRSHTAALMLAAMFVNAGNYGLPVNLFAFGEASMERALVYFSINTVLVFSVGVFVASSGKANTRQALLGVLRVPALYALALAGVALALDIKFPDIIMRPVGLLSQAAVPVMLILLGVQLGRANWPGHLSWLGVAAGLRLLIGPLVAIGLARLFQLAGPARQAAIVEASMPTAVITTILALEYDAEPTLVTGAVVVTTLASPLVLTPLIAFVQST